MIAIAFALEFESAAFRAKLKAPQAETWLLGCTGERTAKALEQKLNTTAAPDVLISAGFAGALQPGAKIGEIVVATNFTTPSVLAKLDSHPGWRLGSLHTSPCIVESHAAKQALGLETGAYIADMETAFLHSICQQRGIPFVSVRTISDLMEEDMPVPADILLDPVTTRPNPMALFRHFIARPDTVPAFGRLLANAKTAQQTLAKGLLEMLPLLR